MNVAAAPLPVSHLLPLSRRQLVVCLLAGGSGFVAARHVLVPNWIARAETGRATLAWAMDQAISEVAGITLACFGIALFACAAFNLLLLLLLLLRERRRRSEASARELAFVTSLGHSLDIPFPSNNPSPRR